METVPSSGFSLIAEHGFTQRDVTRLTQIRSHCLASNGSPAIAHIAPPHTPYYYTNTGMYLYDTLSCAFYNHRVVITHFLRPSQGLTDVSYTLVTLNRPTRPLVPIAFYVPLYDHESVLVAMSKTTQIYIKRNFQDFLDLFKVHEIPIENLEDFFFTKFLYKLVFELFHHNVTRGFASLDMHRRDADLFERPFTLVVPPYRQEWPLFTSAYPIPGHPLIEGVCSADGKDHRHCTGSVCNHIQLDCATVPIVQLHSGVKPTLAPEPKDTETPKATALAKKELDFKRRPRKQQNHDPQLAKLIESRQNQRQTIAAHVTPHAAQHEIAFVHRKRLPGMARAEYAQRHDFYLERVAPPLRPGGNLTRPERLFVYNKNHRCPHRLHFNYIYPQYDHKHVLKEWKVTCDHDREKLAEPLEAPCSRCAAKTVHAVTRNCECSVTRCTRCFNSIYQTPDGPPLPYCNCHQILNQIDFAAELKQMISTRAPTNTNGSYAQALAPKDTRKEFLKELAQPKVVLADFPTLSPDEKPAPRRSNWRVPTVELHSGVAETPCYSAREDDIEPAEPPLEVPEAPPAPTPGLFDPVKTYFANMYNKIKAVFQGYYAKIASTASDTADRIRQMTIIGSLIEMLEKVKERFLSHPPLMLDTILTIAELLFKPFSALVWLRLANTMTWLLTGNPILTAIWELLGAIAGFLSPKTQTPHEVVTHASGDTTPFWKRIVETCKGCWGSFHSTFAPTIKNFNMYCSAAKNFGWLLQKFVGLLPDFLVSLFCSFDSRAYIAQSIKDPDHPFHHAQVLCIKVHMLQTANDPEVSGQRVIAKNAVSACYRHITEGNIALDQNFSKFFETLDRLLYGVPIQAQRKTEPFCIRVSGAPGVGKSLLWPFLLARALRGKSASDIRKMFYTRDPSNEFWDGITADCFGILYDDFNQSRAEEDLNEIIALVSSSTFAPTMASLADKGINVEPQMVMLLSNTTTVSSITLNSSEAINRRPHINLIMHRDSKIDKKLPPTFGPDGLPEGITFTYIPKGADTLDAAKTIIKSLSFAETMVLIENLWNKHHEVAAELDVRFSSFVIPPDPIVERHSAHGALYDKISGWVRAVANGTKNLACLGLRFVSGLLSWLGNVVGFLASITLAVATALGGIVLWKLIRSWFQGDFAQHSGETNTIKPTVAKVALNSGTVDSLLNPCENNVVLLIWPHSQVYIHATFISGNVILTNRHFFLADKDSDYQVLMPQEKAFNILFPNGTFVQSQCFDSSRLVNVVDEDRDLVLYQCTKRIRHFRDITRHFWSGDSLVQNHRTCTINIDVNNQRSSRMYASIVKDIKTFAYPADAKGKVVYQHNAFTYSLASRNGYCGAPIFDLESINQGRIIGIHTGYDGTLSYGLMVSRAQLDSALTKLTANERIPLSNHIQPPTPAETLAMKVQTHSGGTCDKVLFLPTKSDIVPSPLSGVFSEPFTMPAILRRNDARLLGKDPLILGIAKYQGCDDFPEPLVDSAVQSLTEEILSRADDHPRVILSMDQILNGIDGADYFDSIAMNTSAGFPYVLENLTKKDLILLNADGRRYPSARLTSDFNTIEEILLAGALPEVPYLDYLKDERRPFEKVLAGKTRLFSASSVLWTMVVSKYFKDFVAHFYSMHNESFTAVGINKGSLEWHRHVTYLLEVSDKGFDGDYSAWDGTVSAQLIMRIADIVNSYYNDENSQVRHTIMLCESQGLHQYENHIYDTDGGIPTGSPLTVIINTIVNSLYLRIAYQALAPSPWNTMFHFRNLIRCRIYGDDNVVAVSPYLLETFNAHTVGRYLANYRISYGAADKGTTQEAHKPILETSFLKNRIGYQHGFYVPLMPEANLLETINWIRTTFEPEKACEDNCNCSLREFFFHGRERFITIRQAILSIRPQYNLVTYSELLNEFLSFGQVVPFSNDFGQTKHTPDYSPALVAKMRQQDALPIAHELHSGNNASAQSKMNAETTKEITSSIDAIKLEPKSGQGVTLVEQTKPNIVTREHKPTQGTSRRAVSHLNERPWSLETMLSRQNYVDTIVWQLVDPALKVIASYNVLSDLLKQDIVSVPFTRFNYFRCKSISLYFSTAASRFHQGRVIIAYVPTQLRPAIANTPPLNLFNLWALPHIVLDPSVGDNSQLDIDFLHFKGFLDLNEQDSLGQLYVVVHNQLQAATGSQPSVSIKMFMTVNDPVFEIPREGGSSYNEITNTPVVALHSGIMAAVMDGVEGVINAIEPENLIGDIIGTILDKPQVNAPPDQVSLKFRGTMNNGVGAEQIDKFQLYPAKQQLCDMEHFNLRSELLLSPHFKHKLSYLSTTRWTATDIPGSILFQTRVGPLADAGPVEPNKPFALNEMDYFCLGFQYWRGSLHYVFEVVSSNFHEGRLDITYHPNTSPAPVDYNAAMSQYAASMFIRQAGNTLAVACPYLADKPWKTIYAGQPTAVVPSDGKFRFQDFFSGTLALRVSASLRAPQTVVPNVDINVYVYGGSDFEVSWPGFNNRSISVVPSEIRRKVQLHSGKKDTPFNVNSSPEGQKATFLAPEESLTYDPKIPHFGEKFDNIQELLKRYGKAIRVPLKQVDKGIHYATFSLFYVFSAGDATNLFHIRYLTCFRNFRGPLCWKFKLTGTQWSGTSIPQTCDAWVSYNPGVLPPDQFVAERAFGAHAGTPHTLQTAFPMAYFDEHQQAEIETPFLSMSATALVAGRYDKSINLGNATDYLSGSFLFAVNTNDSLVMDGFIDISLAFGDETQVGVFIGQPPVHFAVDGAGISPWPDYWLRKVYTRDEWDNEEDWTTEITPASGTLRKPSTAPVRGTTRK